MVSFSYYARNLDTTNLSKDYQPTKEYFQLPYVARGLLHDGQLRATRRSQVYRLPSISARSSVSQEIGKESKSSAKPTRVPYKRMILPDITRTAGVPTLETVRKRGWAKGYAASRSDTGSLVHALYGPEYRPLHVSEKQYFLEPPTSDKNYILVPHGREDYHYTDLELHKKHELRKAYLDAMDRSNEKRHTKIRHRIAAASIIKHQNSLHVDHATSAILGVEPSTPIPNRERSGITKPPRPDRSDAMESLKRTWKNMSGAYQNIWNSKLQNKSESEE